MPYKQYLNQSEEELDAARLLFEKGFYREAISRVYYSMFHATQALFFERKKEKEGEALY